MENVKVGRNPVMILATLKVGKSIAKINVKVKEQCMSAMEIVLLLICRHIMVHAKRISILDIQTATEFVKSRTIG